MCLKCSKRVIYSGNDSQHGGHEENADWLHEHYENDAKGPFGKKQTTPVNPTNGNLVPDL